MRNWAVVAVTCCTLAACATYTPPRAGPTVRGMDLSIMGTGGQYDLRAVTVSAPYVHSVKAGSKKTFVDPQSYGRVSVSGRNTLSEQVAGSGRCFVLVDERSRAVPIWPKSYGRDVYGFSLVPVRKTIQAQQLAIQAQQAYTTAILNEASARDNAARAQQTLRTSPVYRGDACVKMQPTSIERPFDAISPAEASHRAEGVIQEAMAAQLGCTAAGEMLAQMGKTPQWTGFLGGFACNEAARPRSYPKDNLTIVADLAQHGLASCMANRQNNSVTRMACGAVLLGTLGLRYAQDTRTLTDQYSQPYYRWQNRVRLEKARVDSVNNTCTTAQAIVQNGPSNIASIQSTVSNRRVALETAQTRLRVAQSATYTGAALRCN